MGAAWERHAMCKSAFSVSYGPLILITNWHGLNAHRETAVLCCGLEKNGMVGAWHGHGLASVNQTRLHCANQMGKTHFKPLAAQHGRGTACYMWISLKGMSRQQHTSMCRNNITKFCIDMFWWRDFVSVYKKLTRTVYNWKQSWYK